MVFCGFPADGAVISERSCSEYLHNYKDKAVVSKGSRKAFSSLVCRVTSVNAKCLNLFTTSNLNLKEITKLLWVNETSHSNQGESTAAKLEHSIKESISHCGPVRSKSDTDTEFTASSVEEVFAGSAAPDAHTEKADVDGDLSFDMFDAPKEEDFTEDESVEEEYWGFSADSDVETGLEMRNCQKLSLPVSVPAETEEVDTKPKFLYNIVQQHSARRAFVTSTSQPGRALSFSKPDISPLGPTGSSLAGLCPHSVPSVKESEPQVDVSRAANRAAGERRSGRAGKKSKKKRKADKPTQQQTNGAPDDDCGPSYCEDGFDWLSSSNASSTTINSPKKTNAILPDSSHLLTAVSTSCKMKAASSWLKRPYRLHKDATSIWMSTPPGGKGKKSGRLTSKKSQQETQSTVQVCRKSKKMMEDSSKAPGDKPNKQRKQSNPKRKSDNIEGHRVEKGWEQGAVEEELPAMAADLSKSTSTLEKVSSPGVVPEHLEEQIVHGKLRQYSRPQLNSDSNSIPTLVIKPSQRKKKKRSPRTAFLVDVQDSKKCRELRDFQSSLSPAMYAENSGLVSAFERKSKVDAMKNMRLQKLFSDVERFISSSVSSTGRQSIKWLNRSGGVDRSDNTARTHGGLLTCGVDVGNIADRADDKSTTSRKPPLSSRCSPSELSSQTFGPCMESSTLQTENFDLVNKIKEHENTFNLTNNNNVKSHSHTSTISSSVNLPLFLLDSSDSDEDEAIQRMRSLLDSTTSDPTTSRVIPSAIVGYANGLEYRFQPVIDDQQSQALPLLESRGYLKFNNQFIPYVVLNGFKYIQVCEATKLFTRCGRRCSLPKKLLLRNQAMLAYLTFEQVNQLDRVKSEHNTSANTGDPIIRCQGVLDNLESLEGELELLHSTTCSRARNCQYSQKPC